MISYLQAIDVIRTFALNHYFINKFDFEFREQMPNLATLDEAYPLLFVVPIASDTIQNVNEFDIDVYCVDRYQKDRTNVNYVVSDCNQTLNDLVLWLEEGQDDIEIVSTSTQTPINNDLLDYVGGWVLRLRLQVEKIGLCEIPFKGGQPTPPSCPSGFIRNSDESFTDIIPSGATVTLDDITVNVYDQDENFLGTTTSPSNIDVNVTVEIEPCPPAEVNAEAINSKDNIVTTALLTPENNQILAPDGIVSIRKSDNVEIYNVSTPSNETTAQVVADSVVTLKDSANTTISTTNVQATESANITAPDGAITVNGSSVGGVKSNGTRNLFVKLNGTNSGTYDGVDTINLTSPTPIGGQLLATNQTISYATGDDGDTEAGRNFFTLASNNPFGNTNRFTDVVGGQTYANNVVIDWSTWNGIDGSTVIGYKRTLRANGINWSTAISEANALNFGGFASGWRVCNLREYYNLYNYALPVGTPLNYAPFSLTPILLWTSQTLIDATTSAFNMTNVGLHSSLIKTHTGNISYMARRYYTINGTTLS